MGLGEANSDYGCMIPVVRCVQEMLVSGSHLLGKLLPNSFPPWS